MLCATSQVGRIRRVGITVVVAASLILGACSSGTDSVTSDSVASDSGNVTEGISPAEFQVAAAPVCAQFAADLPESTSLSEPYVVASAALQEIGPVAGEDAESLVSAMEDAAALAASLQAEIDAVIKPGLGYWLTENGTVWIGESLIFAGDSRIPAEFGLAFMEAQASLQDVAVEIGLPACGPIQVQ